MILAQPTNFDWAHSAARARLSRFAPLALDRSEGEWRTIHGAHVKIGADGKISHGPAGMIGKAMHEVGAEHGHGDAKPGMMHVARDAGKATKAGEISKDKEGNVVRGYHHHDSETHARIQTIKLPPGWSDVQVSQDPKSGLQAIGKDSKGRVQYRYSAEHSGESDAAKWARHKKFVAARQGIREKIANDPSEEAAALRLIDHTGFRVGSDNDTGAKEQAYGATTLEHGHIQSGEDGETIAQFVGKKGVHQRHEIAHEGLAQELRERAAKGGKLYNTTDAKVRDYLHKIAPGFKVKDFRTAVANETAHSAMKEMARPTDHASYAKSIADVSSIVAKKLGNAPSESLKSYISPATFSAWRTHVANHEQADLIARYAVEKGINPEQAAKDWIPQHAKSYRTDFDARFGTVRNEPKPKAADAGKYGVPAVRGVDQLRQRAGGDPGSGTGAGRGRRVEPATVSLARLRLSRIAPLALSHDFSDHPDYWREIDGHPVPFHGDPGHGHVAFRPVAKTTPAASADHGIDFGMDAMHGHQEPTGPERKREHNIGLAHRYDLAGKRGNHAIYRDRKSGKHYLEVARHGDTHVTLEHTHGPAEHEMIRPASTHVDAARERLKAAGIDPHKDMFGNDRAIQPNEGIFGEGTTAPAPKPAGETAEKRLPGSDPKHTGQMFPEKPADSLVSAKHASLIAEGLDDATARSMAERFAAVTREKDLAGEKKISARDRLKKLAPNALKVKALGPATATGDDSAVDRNLHAKAEAAAQADMAKVHAKAVERVAQAHARLKAVAPNALAGATQGQAGAVEQVPVTKLPASDVDMRYTQYIDPGDRKGMKMPPGKAAIYHHIRGVIGFEKNQFDEQAAAKHPLGVAKLRELHSRYLSGQRSVDESEVQPPKETTPYAPPPKWLEEETRYAEARANRTQWGTRGVGLSRVYLSLAPTMPDNTTEHREEKMISLGGAHKTIMVSRFKKDVLAPGSYVHPLTKQKFLITPEDIDDFVTKFRLMRAKGIDIHVPVDHKMTAEANRGFVVEAEKRNGRLCLTHEMIGEDAALLAMRNRASVLIDPNYVDEFDNKWGKCIVHSALTPIPVISGMGGFQAVN